MLCSRLFFHLTNIDMPHRHDLALVVVRFGSQAHGKGHRAYTAHKHNQHIQDLCPVVQLAGYAYGKAHRTKGRAGLEDGIHHGHGVRGVVVHHNGRADDR